MIRLNWEEVALVVLFSAVAGWLFGEGNWSAMVACAAFVGMIVFSGYRAAVGISGDTP